MRPSLIELIQSKSMGMAANWRRMVQHTTTSEPRPAPTTKHGATPRHAREVIPVAEF